MEEINMKITDVKVRKLFDEGPMKAVVSVTFDNEFAVHDIKVIYAKERYFIVMPTRKNADGSYRDVAHPITASFRGELEAAVLDAYDAAVTEALSEASENAGSENE
jgi:stage V sporulation protein G